MLEACPHLDTRLACGWVRYPKPDHVSGLAGTDLTGKLKRAQSPSGTHSEIDRRCVARRQTAAPSEHIPGRVQNQKELGAAWRSGA